MSLPPTSTAESTPEKRPSDTGDNPAVHKASGAAPARQARHNDGGVAAAGPITGRAATEASDTTSVQGNGLAGAIRRHSGWIKGLSAALIVLSLLLLVRSLPLDRAIDLLKLRVQGWGFRGPLVLGAVYILAALLFVPGSALTLTAGAVFGLGWGTLTVSLASTTAAAAAFLIARYVARDAVARQARRSPNFAAIDRAIADGGWRIIALLRLSPAVPFSLGNYLFGLTAIRFRPYVLASWLFMLPGTFLYVYLGHVGSEGLRSAAGAQRAKTPGEWAMLGVGLLATLAVTVYVTRLARRALRERARIDDDTEAAQPPAAPEEREPATATSWPWGTTLTAVVAIAMVVAAGCAYQARAALRNLFGPAPVTLHEAYQRRPGGPTFDHSRFDQLLHRYVNADGWVDYRGLEHEAAALDGYIASLGRAPLADLDRDEKLALLINAYNAFTLRLILDYYPVASIKDIPAAKRWDDRRWHIGPLTLSLNQIEHEQIRPKFAEPRVHFALVCAAIGCPKLRNEAYRADRINEQLEDQTRYVHTHERWFRYEPVRGVVHLTRLYQWYGGDFTQIAGSVLQFAARYVPQLKAALDGGATPRIDWLPYDWTLNDRKNER